MSGLIVVCVREGRPLPFSDDEVKRCILRLAPDNVVQHDPAVTVDDGLIVAVIDPVPGLPVAERAVCVGGLVGAGQRWYAVGAPRPEGSYAVCRCDDRTVELLADTVASRTLWYVQTEGLFIAATSQRAIAYLLGSFTLDDEAVAWMASSGTLGPGHAWDARVRQIPPAATLRLDRARWDVTLESTPPDSATEPLTDEGHLRRWRQAILDACEQLDVSLDTWVLPLSGGLDSRTILAALMEVGRRPRCVTWGLRRSLEDPENDAAIARKLCEHYGVEGVFLPTDPDGVAPETVLSRYLAAGEGRSDEIAGYLDGLELWRRLREEGVAGVIRGDEPAWGYSPDYHSEAQVQRRMHLQRIADHAEGSLIRRLDLAPQRLPAWVPLRPGETLLAYRERLYEATSFPGSFAGLNGVKCAYVEVVNPLVADRIVRVARALPPQLLERRRGFTAVANALGPPIPEAKHSALAGSDRLLRAPAFVAVLSAELESAGAERVCSRRGLDELVGRLRRVPATPGRPTARSVARAVVPETVRRRLKPDPPLVIDAAGLSRRLVIASRMAAMLTDDAAARAPGR